MGYVRVDAALKNPFTGRSVSVKAPIDTGVTLTVISRKVADELGLPVIGRAPWRLWVGRHIHILVSNDVDAVLIGVVTPEIPGF
jgi:predicted aspartyl protease